MWVRYPCLAKALAVGRSALALSGQTHKWHQNEDFCLFVFASRIYFENFYTDIKDRQRHYKKITNILYKYWHQNPEQNTSKPKQYIKRVIHYDQEGFIPGIWEWVNRQKLISVICHLNRMKEKNQNHHFIIEAIKEPNEDFFSFSFSSALFFFSIYFYWLEANYFTVL